MIPAIGTNTPAPAPSPTARRSVFGRIARAITTPVRYAIRRPRKAALIAFALLLIAAAVTFAGVWIWFDSHLRAARREVERGHNASATTHLRACQTIRPEHREVLILSARVARRSGSWGEAEAFLTHYWERYGDEEPLVLERLLLRATRGDLQGVGAQLLARVRADGPEARLAREGLVTGLLYQFRWGEAERLLAEWLAQNPDDTIALLLRGKLDEQRQRYALAADTFRRVVELDPEHDEARLRLTTLLLGNRFGEEALSHLTELRKRLPNHPEIAIQWVRALALQGRTAESRVALDACLRDHPNYPAALAERGGFALLDGDEPAAERDFARAAGLDPGNMAIRSQYALALARNGKPADAARELGDLERLKADMERITALIEGPLQTRPNDPAVHHEIAEIALRAGQLREAIRWYESALKVDPDHLPTHRVLTVIYQEIDNPILAARHRAIAQRLAAQKKP